MTFVVDASLALTWCFPDEATPRTEALLDRLGRTEGVVPQIWPIEMANVLLGAERTKRYSEAEVSGMLGILSALRLSVDFRRAADAFVRVLPLARAHGLTVYDATYLELAMRRGLPLATNDDDLRAAAISAGIEVL